MGTKHIATTAAAVLGAGTLAMATAPSAQAVTISAEHVGTHTVLDGKIAGLMGNQHRLLLQTDTEGSSWPQGLRKITSYYCPSGSRITTGWTSSKCVKRGTTYFSYDKRDLRVSSTMNSAVLEGNLRSGTKRFPVKLTWYGAGQRDVSPYGPNAQIRSQLAKVYGSVGTAKVRPTERTYSTIHRLELL